MQQIQLLYQESSREVQRCASTGVMVRCNDFRWLHQVSSREVQRRDEKASKEVQQIGTSYRFSSKEVQRRALHRCNVDRDVKLLHPKGRNVVLHVWEL